ncbi:MAG: HupE/UreJ family protein [Verrucomicrobiae bacterium]|nr:HupE/UreJ family protein [Verrucomicrobiae bacterium]
MNSCSLFSRGWARVLAWTALVSAVPIVAQAHPGHPETTSWLSGALHPLSGWDHALALLAAGLWGAQRGGRARWALPAVFLAAMAAGVPLAAAFGTLPGLESLILASLLVLGLAVAFAVRAPLLVAVALVGGFALAHGASHGLEMASSGRPWAYAAGFLASSAVWLAIGTAVGLAAARWRKESWLRWAGAAVALGGICGFAA